MSSTKDPKSERECWMCGASVKPFESVMMCTNLNCCNWRKPTHLDTPQATKPVDEQIEAILAEYRISILIADMITGPKTRIKGFKKCTDQTTQAIEALLTEARINELENWAYCGASKWEIDERIAELKGEAPTPTKEREEQ